VLDKSTGSVRYELRELDDHESVAIDMHSHGHIPAFFSDTDDRDDAGSVKISGVVGNLDSDTPTAAFRLCVLGLYLPINVPADRIFGSAA
jgi:PRTRC genetic system protein A